MEFRERAPEIEGEHIQNWKLTADPADKNRIIEEILDHLGGRVTLSASTLFRSRLCLDEALTNAITHGSDEDGLPIEVDFYWATHSWAVRVLDQGPGFDPADVQDPDEPGSEFLESGRGILILERYCERVVYSRGGREVTLVMKLEEVTA